MKVAIVIDHWFPSVGGGPRQVSEIASRLGNYREIEITVVTSNLFTGVRQGQLIKQCDFKVVHLGKPYPYTSLLGRLNFLFNLFFFLFRHDFDILHVHPFTPLPVVKAISLIRRRPIVATVHLLGKEVSGLTNHPFLSRILQSFDSFFTFRVSYSAQIFVDRALMKRRNATKNRLFIPNGVNVGVFDRVQVKKTKSFQVLFVGRFHPQKNLATLIRAFKVFTVRYPQSKLVLVGEGEEEEKLKSQVNELKITTRVRFIPPLFGLGLIRLYKSSHLFILPSRYEGFPITILEAWAARLPVAATPVGMVKELVKDRVNGFVINSPTVEEVIRTLEKVVQSKQLDQLGKKGYEMVAKKYSWDQVAEETYQVYREINSS